MTTNTMWRIWSCKCLGIAQRPAGAKQRQVQAAGVRIGAEAPHLRDNVRLAKYFIPVCESRAAGGVCVVGEAGFGARLMLDYNLDAGFTQGIALAWNQSGAPFVRKRLARNSDDGWQTEPPKFRSSHVFAERRSSVFSGT
jgi:hypothetical protein